MFDWDNVCPADQWKHSHNYMHHTFTNIVGKDRDVGYGILRMDEDQKWNPYYLGNPLYAFLLMTFFEWGVMLHDLEVEEIVAGRRTWAETKRLRGGMLRKAKKQVIKDYLLFPLLTGPLFPLTIAGNATANLIRNIWPSTSSSAATSRPASRPSRSRRPRTRPVGSGTTASCSARPTSAAASCCT